MSTLLVKELKSSKYRLLGLVGQGQFGRVYCAIHRRTGHLVALKELNKDRFPTNKFLRELRFLLSLQHPNIVNCHALEHTRTGRYLVMDYCEGGTLRSLMEEDMRLHPAQGLKLIADVLSGLDHAHHRGIVHCDIKPENILLTVQPNGWTARISDFGIARLSQEISKDGSGNTGSPAYMAPERFYGQHSLSSDLYAVGVLLFELLAGYRPFSGPPAELMSAHLNQPVKVPDTIPAALRSIILTALQKLPARRFRSAFEMLSALEAAKLQLIDDPGEAWEPAQLLKSTAALASCAFTPVRQEILQAEVKQIIGQTAEVGTLELHRKQSLSSDGKNLSEGERVYQIFGSYVGCQSYPNGILSDASEPGSSAVLTSVRLPEPVQQLSVRPQGCFALSSRSVYLIPFDLFKPGVAQHGQKRLQQGTLDNKDSLQHLIPQLIAEFPHHFVAAIAPEGNWMATAPLTPGKTSNSIRIWDLVRAHPIKQIAQTQSHLFQLIALDARHFAALSHTVDSPTSACISGVEVKFFTRRGNGVGQIDLPIPLRCLQLSHIPYRLIGLEPGITDMVTLIDLKPLRILRVYVGISPVLIAPTSWGCVLADEQGQIVLIDQYGQRVGQIDGPPNPTAIATPDAHTLIVSTWQKGEGDLHIVDLRQLDLDFMF